MDKVKKILHEILHDRLIVTGKDRTFARVPLWLVVLAVIGGRHAFLFAILTGVMIAGLGMDVAVERN